MLRFDKECEECLKRNLKSKEEEVTFWKTKCDKLIAASRESVVNRYDMRRLNDIFQERKEYVSPLC